ncbi:GMC family oxidoreductase N-terminal domain-containing protein [Shimia sp. R10_1]|uniref:GMC family oxidoreductase n=1 Tax=Shimia sp. R10_1 TaxID=2821095 RepID=UPI001AD9D7E7|nr:GMC family oxidoreductase N-terminal domain-containing protein [Shimia sp. R10_1]MBO9475292.1 GMC family oxidoreductase N-terminal domain-containing protein [Shimia sp. R10_1]
MSRQIFDYVIVGGGSSGCVLAARLSEDPDVTVALVEAGGRDRSPLFHMPAGFAKMTKGIASWGWSTVPQKGLNGRSLWYTQARVIGGGSSINAQIYTRGNRKDYDNWSEVHGCDGWSYREVLPYFKRAEGNERFEDDYHGGDGPLGVSMPRGALPICSAFIRAAQQWGLPYNPDFNGKQQAGCGFYQLTQKDARRSSTAQAYLKPVESRPNLTVMTGAQVRRIVLDKRRAAGVEVMNGSDRTTLLAECEVLLTSGAIGSPRLLMLSGIGPADHLRSVGIDVQHDLPGVGSNLQDHVDLCTISQCTGRHTYDGTDRIDRTILAGLQYYLTKTGPVTASLFETGGFWYADDGADAPDMQFHLGQGSGIEKGIVKIDGCGVTLNSTFARPRSRGTVRLASDQPDAAPLIDPNFWGDPYDREMSLRGLEIAREIMQQPALKDYVRHEVLPGRNASEAEVLDYAMGIAKTDHHPVGTCKMGHDDMAVVDTELKIHGLEGIRVCDASIMPAINSSNTNAPTIMIGEKASDMVRGLDPLPAVIFADERNEDRRDLA